MSEIRMKTLDDLVRTLDKNPEYRKQYRIKQLIYDIANEIYTRRKELNITQAELAERLGKKQSAISRIESAENNIRINTLAEIAEALDARITVGFIPRIKDEEYTELFNTSGERSSISTYTKTAQSKLLYLFRRKAMDKNLRYPFKLNNAFFSTLKFSRPEKVPEETLPTSFEVKINVTEDNFPEHLQIRLRMETTPEVPFEICIELIGLFDLVEGHNPDQSIIPDFLNERALFMLWPYITQTVAQITSTMGMDPIKLATPYSYFFQLENENAEAAH